MIRRAFDLGVAVSLTILSAATAANGSWAFALLGLLFAGLACRRVFPKI